MAAHPERGPWFDSRQNRNIFTFKTFSWGNEEKSEEQKQLVVFGSMASDKNIGGKNADSYFWGQCSQLLSDGALLSKVNTSKVVGSE